MHDIRAIRENPAAFDAALARRGVSDASSGLLKIDGDRRAAILAAETAQAEQNKASNEVGAAKGRGDEAEFERLRALVAEKKAEVAEMNALAKELDEALTDALARLPNLPHDDIPDGADEADNVEIHRWGTPPEIADAKEHYDLPAARGLDFETAAKLSGSRFVVLRGAMARLHRGLAQFMLDTHVNEHGLTETMTPVLVRDEAMFGTGQLPKFTEDSYQTTNGWWLIPTSEVTLTNTVAGDLLEEADLPIRMTAHTQCFRSEAGSAGRDTAGMLRQHQFEKVEMVQFGHPDESWDALEALVGDAETILQKLELPYRTVVLCGGDLGFSAAKTYDIEVWLPSQGKYREISSCSNFGDFQARRMKARFRNAEGKPELLHTLNGSGLAVGRTLLAVMENYQQADGSIAIPDVLRPLMNGQTHIK